MGRFVGAQKVSSLDVINGRPWEDGDEVIFNPDPAFNWVYWRMVYNSAIGDAYKWVFTGGIPIRIEVNANVTRAAGGGTYADGSGTTGPSWVTPRAGAYNVYFGSQCDPVADSDGARMAIKMGTNTASDNGAALNNNQRSLTLTSVQDSPILASGSTIKAQYRNNGSAGGTTTWSKRWVEILPIRLS